VQAENTFVSLSCVMVTFILLSWRHTAQSSRYPTKKLLST